MKAANFTPAHFIGGSPWVGMSVTPSRRSYGVTTTDGDDDNVGIEGSPGFGASRASRALRRTSDCPRPSRPIDLRVSPRNMNTWRAGAIIAIANEDPFTSPEHATAAGKEHDGDGGVASPSKSVVVASHAEGEIAGSSSDALVGVGNAVVSPRQDRLGQEINAENAQGFFDNGHCVFVAK